MLMITLLRQQTSSSRLLITPSLGPDEVDKADDPRQLFQNYTKAEANNLNR